MSGHTSYRFIASAFALAGALIAAPASATIVVNGGFETGDFTGWTTTGDPTESFVVADPGVAQSGTYGASFGFVGSTGGISQVLTTTAGALYAVDFWLQAESDVLGTATPNSFSFSWGGTTVAGLTDAPAFGYQHYVYSLLATGASTTIAFSFRDDPAFWDLDNVAVNAVAAPVPEPETWAMFGLGLAWLAARRRRAPSRA